VTESLASALEADLALIRIGEHLLARARDLHRAGLSGRNLRPAQMAAVGELVRAAPSWKEATKRVDVFLAGQLEKLRARAEREGRATSWLVPPRPPTEEGIDSLGEALRRWLAEERYLPADRPAGLDRLAALQRFWEYVHGMYRYGRETEQEMRIPALTAWPPEETR
jgi:hypothetical protein